MNSTADRIRESPTYQSKEDQDSLRVGLPGLLLGTQNHTASNVVLVGAPQTGKTHLVLEIIAVHGNAALVHSSEGEEKVTEIAQETGAPTDQLFSTTALDEALRYEMVFVDDCYRVIDECIRYELLEETPLEPHEEEPVSSNTSGQLQRLLARQAGICLITTPYRWNSLINGNEARMHDLIEPVLEEDTLLPIYLKYTQNDAKNAFETLPEEVTRSVQQPVFSEYELDVKLPGGQMDSYNTSVPFALMLIDRRTVPHLPSIVQDVVTDEFQAQVSGPLNELGESLLPGLQGLVVGAGMAAGVSIPIAIGTQIVFSKYRDTSSEYEDIKNPFGSLLELSPVEMELIEAEAKIEPLTLERSRTMLKEGPGQFSEITARLDNHATILQELAEESDITTDDIDEIINGITTEIETEIDGMRDIVSLYEDSVNRAIRSPEDRFRPWIEKLREEYFDHTVLEPNESWKLVSTKQTEQVIERIETEAPRLLLVTGPSGIGKTTTAYQVMSELADYQTFVGDPC